jgi:hypothetical protein
MSIFSKIKDAIFGRKADAAPAAEAPAIPMAEATPATPTAPAPMSEVDIEATLAAMQGADDLNWRTSIVDLMKLLGIDSSLANREALAQELGYTGELNGSAENEHLAAQGNDARAGCERRQGSGRHARLSKSCGISPQRACVGRTAAARRESAGPVADPSCGTIASRPAAGNCSGSGCWRPSAGVPAGRHGCSRSPG